MAAGVDAGTQAGSECWDPVFPHDFSEVTT
jgi:hypothetical protein